MAKMKVHPEYVLADNPHGRVAFGPIAPENKDDNTAMVVALKGGHFTTYNKDGNKGEIVPGASHEHCGSSLVQGENTTASNEEVSKSITAHQGDIVIVAEEGNIKLKAKNIWIETTGSGNDGSFMVKANDHITMTAGEQMTLGGAKVCMLSSDTISLNSKGPLWFLCSDIHKKSADNPIMKILLQGPAAFTIESFIDAIRKTCK